MKAPRSMIFYVWLALLADFLLVLGVVAFVLAGAAYQRSAILLLSRQVQRMQIANLTLRGDFLDTQRALRGYQATSQARFLQTFYADQAGFVLELAGLRDLAWRHVLGGVLAQEEAAHAAFLRGGQAVLAPRGSRDATALYEQASASSDAFIRRNQQLQGRLSADSRMLIAKAQRTLGIGMVGTSIILAAGLLLPVLAFGLALRWTSTPLHRLTTTVRRRALGDLAVRAPVGGPADVRDLARSVNFLADESDRLRSVRTAATRIYEHLHAPAIISEAIAALEDHLAVDTAWVGLIRGESLISLTGPPGTGDVGPRGPDPQPGDGLAWVRQLFRQRSSYCRQAPGPDGPENLPPPVKDLLRDPAADSLLLTPFGVSSEPMGVLALLRGGGPHAWTEPEIEAVESLARDIGRALEHARLYENEERHVAELKSLDRAKSSFIAASSHDLRTPLTSIIGYVELLADADAGPVTPTQAMMLDAVSRNGRRLQNLIEDMLTISKIQLGAFTSRLSPVDLARQIPGPVDLVLPTAQGRDITFDVSAPDEGLIVNGDAEQLDRVLMNLLTNAVKYTPPGGTVTLTAGAEDGDAVMVIRDTGIGIPAGEQASLCTPFFRASNAVSRAIQGSGLGLSIVRTILDHHHGTLEVDSAEGAGTTVAVRIPLLQTRTAPRVPQPQRPVP